MEMILAFVNKVLILKIRWSFSVTSWGRTEKRNISIGGVPGSLHLLFMGLDVVLDDMKKNVDFEKDADRLGLLALFEDDHYHLQPK
jgi:hypothetical protein